MASIDPGVTSVEQTDAFCVGGNHLVRNAVEGLQSAWRENAAAGVDKR